MNIFNSNNSNLFFSIFKHIQTAIIHLFQKMISLLIAYLVMKLGGGGGGVFTDSKL